MNAEEKKRWGILGSVLIITLLLVWNAPSPNSIDNADTLGVVKATRSFSTKPEEQPSDDFLLLPRSAETQDTVNLFNVRNAPKPEKSLSVVSKPTLPAAPPAPTAPPIPYYFVGKIIDNHQIKGFIQEADSIIEVKEGQIIGANYKVVSIDNNGVNVIYIPLNTPQTIRENPNKNLAPAALTEAQKRAKLAVED